MYDGSGLAVLGSFVTATDQNHGHQLEWLGKLQELTDDSLCILWGQSEGLLCGRCWKAGGCRACDSARNPPPDVMVDLGSVPARVMQQLTPTVGPILTQPTKAVASIRVV